MLWHFHLSYALALFKLSTASTLGQTDLFEEALWEYGPVSGTTENDAVYLYKNAWKDRKASWFINVVQLKPRSWVSGCISGEIKMSQRFTSLSLQAASLFSARQPTPTAHCKKLHREALQCKRSSCQWGKVHSNSFWLQRLPLYPELTVYGGVCYLKDTGFKKS